MTPDVMSEGEAKILEAYAEVEEALDRFRADQREGLEALLSGKDLAEVALRSKIEADRLRRENEELRAEILRLKTERAENLAARAVDAQYRPNVTGRTNEVKPDEWPVFAAPAHPDRDDDAILARFDFHPVDTDRWLRMDTVRGRFRGLAAFLLAFTPDGRYRNLALTKLEEAMHFANKAVARVGPNPHRSENGVHRPAGRP